MNVTAIIEACQEILAKKDPSIDVDGLAGPQTWGAIYKALAGKSWGEGEGATGQLITGTVDERSERNIMTLLPEVRPYARALVIEAKKQGIVIVVTSGTRTYQEQNDLYEQGRSRPGNRVTNAKGGFSNHNFGIAFDITVDGPKSGFDPVWEGPAYKVVGAIGKSLGLTWGGNWSSIQDEPHFELKPNWAKELSESDMLSALRSRHDSNKPVFA